MGTNYYWKVVPQEIIDLGVKYSGTDSIGLHIGKRSSAGLYCFDCGTTFCSEGDNNVHMAHSSSWTELCPICGKSPETSENIRRVSSFTWTMKLHYKILLKMLKEHPLKKVVKNEYGETFTAKEFLLAIDTPIQFQMPVEFC